MKNYYGRNLWSGTDAERLAVSLVIEGTLWVATDTNKIWGYMGGVWHSLSGSGTGGMEIHGNEYHDPDYATQANIDTSINTHKAIAQTIHGFDASGNAPAQTHDNTRHSAAYIVQANAVVPNTPITGATKTKITYDTKGLITGGTDATYSDVGAEQANANIQTHVTSAHAPSNAQKNSDIIQSEIEAKLTGEIATHTHAGGSGGSELWEGKVHVAMYDGNPMAEPFQVLSGNTTISPTVTPTNIGIAVGRIVAFRFKTAITVTTIRWYGIAAVSAIYTAAIYRDSDGARLWSPGNVNTLANAWNNSVVGGLPITFAADTLYWFGIGADTTGTSAGFVTPQLPKVAAFGLATPAWAGLSTVGLRFCQVALTAGAWPATLPAKVNAAAWTGFIPAFYLCAAGY